jgi:hypothetical protein
MTDSRPVSPPSELTAEEVRATNALFEAMREAGLFGRKRQAVEDAAHHLAAVARAAARAAPQADANLDGYWERAYWEIVPKLAAALAAPQADTLRCGICDGREDDPYHGPEPCILCPHASSHHSFRAAPQADAGTLREARITTVCDLIWDHGVYLKDSQPLAAAIVDALAASPATAGKRPELPPPDMTLIEGTPENKAWHREHDETP